MILKTARVTDFRSIDDSTVVDIDPKVTALVGQNESGKTAFLQALHKARSTEKGIGFNVTEDYPRKNLLDYESDHEDDPTVVVEFSYQLEPQELAAINAWLGHEHLSSLGFSVSHKYDDTTAIGLTTQEPAHVQWLIANTALSSDAKQAVAGAATLGDFFKLAEGADLTPSDVETVDALKIKYPAPSGTWGWLNHAIWTIHLSSIIPVFLYFDDYRILPGKTYLNGLQQRKVSEELTDGDRGTLRLLDIAKLTPKMLAEAGGYEREKARLEATGNKISKKVFGFWRQNTDLKVQFDVAADPKDVQPFNEGKNLYIRIENRRHEVTVPFDQRSKGFIWFFSFIAWFDSIREEIQGNRRIILLLDEPGLSLHALAQADFLRYIEGLSEEHQILYSTHSPFMVESSRLDRVRTVEDRGDGGTRVRGDVSGADPKTLFPLQAALGYSIAQNLFISDKSLLVEGIADVSFLQTASEILKDLGRTGLADDVVITPVGGVGKISAFASLFGANDLRLAVLYDFGGQEDQQIARLVRDQILPKKGVFHYASFRDEGGSTKPTDVEDLLNPGTYVRYFNTAFESAMPQKLKVGDLDPGDRILERINRHLVASGVQLRPSGGFNHFTPAKAFAADPPSNLSDVELARFERLFKAVNKAFE